MSEIITLKNGKKQEISKGDIVFVAISPDDYGTIVKTRFVEKNKDNMLKVSIITPKMESIDIILSERRVIRTEKPN